MLHSLLDDHPDVVAVPPFLLLQNFYDFWQQSGHLPIDDLVAEFIAQNTKWFSIEALHAGIEAAYRFGPKGLDDISVDADRFGSALFRHLRLADNASAGRHPTTRRRLFQAIQVAYQEAMDRQVASPSPLVVFSLHTPAVEYARQLREDFPDARIIHVIREPVASFGAHLFHHLYEFPQPPFDDYSERMVRFLLRSDRPLVDDQDVSRAVRFEDLHLDPEGTMRAVANWVGLPWHPKLLQPTYSGRLASHERRGQLISGTDPARARYRVPDTMHVIDRVFLRLVLRETRLAWGYGWFGGTSRGPALDARERARALKTTIASWVAFVLMWVPAKYEWLAWRLMWSAGAGRGASDLATHIPSMLRNYRRLRRLFRAELHNRRAPQPVLPLLQS